MPANTKAEPVPGLLQPTSDIVSAYVSSNHLAKDDLPGFIRTVHGTLSGLNLGKDFTPFAGKAHTSVGKSVTPDYLICLFDGKKLKMLKRYIRARFNPDGTPGHGMTPDDYRKVWGLPADYPMVAANYAKVRSDHAKRIGLGTVPNKTKKPKR